MSIWQKRFKPIPDPIYDSINIPGSLLKFINNPIFQKLRYKKQLACAYLIYPSLNNTRFEHSLGVFHLMFLFFQKFISEIEDRIVIPNYYKDDENLSLIGEKKRVLKEKLNKLNVKFESLVAALYHDIGQSAFSHLIDSIRRRNPDLDLKDDKEYSEKLIREDPILDKIFSDFNKILIQKENLKINKENIIQMITKGKHTEPELVFLGELLNSSIDLDRIDYLNRDCYYSGIINLKIPYNFIMSNIKIFPLIIPHELKKKEKEVYFRLCYDYSAIYSLEFLLISRYFMYKQVYHHLKEKIAENMLVKAIELNLENKLINTDDLHNLGDEQLLHRLKKNKTACEIIDRFYNRELYDIVYYKDYTQLDDHEKMILLDRNIPFDYKLVKEWERSLATKLGLNDTDVIIDIPISRFIETKVKLWYEPTKSLYPFEEHTQFTNIHPYSIDYIICAISDKNKAEKAKEYLFKLI